MRYGFSLTALALSAVLAQTAMGAPGRTGRTVVDSAEFFKARESRDSLGSATQGRAPVDVIGNRDRMRKVAELERLTPTRLNNLEAMMKNVEVGQIHEIVREALELTDTELRSSILQTVASLGPKEIESSQKTLRFLEATLDAETWTPEHRAGAIELLQLTSSKALRGIGIEKALAEANREMKAQGKDLLGTGLQTITDATMLNLVENLTEAPLALEVARSKPGHLADENPAGPFKFAADAETLVNEPASVRVTFEPVNRRQKIQYGPAGLPQRYDVSVKIIDANGTYSELTLVYQRKDPTSTGRTVRYVADVQTSTGKKTVVALVHQEYYGRHYRMHDAVLKVVGEKE